MHSAISPPSATSPGSFEPVEPTHPIWQLLLPGKDTGSGKPYELCELGAPGPGWPSALAAAIERVPVGGTLLVTCERGNRGAILGLLSHRRWRRVRTPRIPLLERALRDAGFDVVARYSVWPSARTARVVLPAGNYSALRWVQRSGVLGGGGKRLFTRALARSAFFTPVSALLTPAVAIVSHRTSAGEAR
ncbi:MAG: hypothetical protein ACRDJS_03495 [Actinomycetota bacterium]